MANKRLAFKLKCPMIAKYISDIKDLEQKSRNVNFLKTILIILKIVHTCVHAYVHVCVSERGYIQMSAGALGEQRCWILQELSTSGSELPHVLLRSTLGSS